jgi:hypothetical protein
MDRWPGRRNALACIALTLLLAACSRPGGSPPAAASAGSSPEPAGASGSPSSGSYEPSVVPSIVPSPSVPADPSIAEPPAASLAVDGGDPVEGELGSFGWLNGGSDSPWLPGNPIHVGRGERLTLNLAAGLALDTWSVSRSPVDQLGDRVVGMGAGSTAPVVFDAPPVGTWSVSVSIWFADNRGSATYYWRMEVD